MMHPVLQRHPEVLAFALRQSFPVFAQEFHQLTRSRDIGGEDLGKGLLAHADNVGPLFEDALKIAEITRLAVHGPEEELAKLREPLAKLKPQFFILEYGFRR